MSVTDIWRGKIGQVLTSSVLYMDRATPPAPVKLKTSYSCFSLDPSGTANHVTDKKVDFNSFAIIQQVSNSEMSLFTQIYYQKLT